MAVESVSMVGSGGGGWRISWSGRHGHGRLVAWLAVAGTVTSSVA